MKNINEFMKQKTSALYLENDNETTLTIDIEGCKTNISGIEVMWNPEIGIYFAGETKMLKEFAKAIKQKTNIVENCL